MQPSPPAARDPVLARHLELLRGGELFRRPTQPEPPRRVVARDQIAVQFARVESPDPRAAGLRPQDAARIESLRAACFGRARGQPLLEQYVTDHVRRGRPVSLACARDRTGRILAFLMAVVCSAGVMLIYDVCADPEYAGVASALLAAVTEKADAEAPRAEIWLELPILSGSYDRAAHLYARHGFRDPTTYAISSVCASGAATDDAAGAAGHDRVTLRRPSAAARAADAADAAALRREAADTVTTLQLIRSSVLVANCAMQIGFPRHVIRFLRGLTNDPAAAREYGGYLYVNRLRNDGRQLIAELDVDVGSIVAGDETAVQWPSQPYHSGVHWHTHYLTLCVRERVCVATPSGADANAILTGYLRGVTRTAPTGARRFARSALGTTYALVIAPEGLWCLRVHPEFEAAYDVRGAAPRTDDAIKHAAAFVREYSLEVGKPGVRRGVDMDSFVAGDGTALDEVERRSRRVVDWVNAHTTPDPKTGAPVRTLWFSYTPFRKMTETVGDMYVEYATGGVDCRKEFISARAVGPEGDVDMSA